MLWKGRIKAWEIARGGHARQILVGAAWRVNGGNCSIFQKVDAGRKDIVACP
jgi:hypothetical protein